MKYLVDDWGHEKLLEKVQEKLTFTLRAIPLSACEPMPIKNRQGHYGIHQQTQEGLNYVGIVTPVGKMLPDQMRQIAKLADRYGMSDIRLTAWQNLIIPHIKDVDVSSFLADLSQTGFSHTTTNVSGGLVACTGSKGCKFAAAETKGKADGHRADFNATLDVIEKAFNDQKQRLDAEDSIDLEVQLDVLRKQMEREGL